MLWSSLRESLRRWSLGPRCRVAGYLDLRVIPGAGRSRETHTRLALRSRLEGSAADSGAIFSVVPRLVVLVSLAQQRPARRARAQTLRLRHHSRDS